jgi:hypothetical protein
MIFVNGYKLEKALCHRIDLDWLEGGIKLLAAKFAY